MKTLTYVNRSYTNITKSKKLSDVEVPVHSSSYLETIAILNRMQYVQNVSETSKRHIQMNTLRNGLKSFCRLLKNLILKLIWKKVNFVVLR